MSEEAPAKKAGKAKPKLKLPSGSGSGGSVGGKGDDGEVVSEQLNNLELGVEFKLDLKTEDFKSVEELGAGNGGTVNKVLHVPTNKVMARKIMHVEAKASVRRQILRELQILHDCHSPYIVSFYGAFMNEGDISICMEFMDIGSLERIYKGVGAFPEDILGSVTLAVLRGLVYLYVNHRIIHRDVKPSNILVNSAGQVKICDFGVSGPLINSVANTFVGTSSYMAPERIQGGGYSVQSDVWSLGISLMELALGRFPFPPDGKPLSIFELLEYIVKEPTPTLPKDKYSPELVDLLTQCLIKDPGKRPTPQQLLSHPYVVRAEKSDVDLLKWTKDVAAKLAKK